MWKIGKIQLTSTRDAHVYGFDISNGLGKALISCCYATEQQAQAAARHMRVGIEQALDALHSGEAVALINIKEG